MEGKYEACTVEFVDNSGDTNEEALFYDFKLEDLELAEKQRP